jgi:predicted GNAT superfamily acetyltransferase
MSIEIRPVKTFGEYMACVTIQQVVWGELEAVPQHMLLTAHKNGGICLGAFDTAAPDAPLVGFVFGFLGRTTDGSLKHTSHMAAVLSGYRDARIGERLKWAQRELALTQGLDLMTWTFDPLISRNAFLNIGKLGAVCRTYERNIYGPEPEDPRGELPSDRFRLDWHLATAGVNARVAGTYSPPTAAELRAQAPLANLSPLDPSDEPVGDRFLMQIPLDIDAVRAADLPRARAWRYQVRALAEAAFAAGFTVTAFARDDEAGLYLLERA